MPSATIEQFAVARKTKAKREREREREREKSRRRERHSARYYKRFAVRKDAARI